VGGKTGKRETTGLYKKNLKCVCVCVCVCVCFVILLFGFICACLCVYEREREGGGRGRRRRKHKLGKEGGKNLGGAMGGCMPERINVQPYLKTNR